MNIVEIVNLIFVVAQMNHVDPQLAMAVAATESNFNPNVVGSQGEIGLFQIKPSSANRSAKDLFDPRTNVIEGIKYIKQMSEQCHTKAKATFIVCYNTGVSNAKKIKHPEKFIYYKKVMEKYKKFKYAYKEEVSYGIN